VTFDNTTGDVTYEELSMLFQAVGLSGSQHAVQTNDV